MMNADKIKILVIDDNADNLITMKALIQEAFTDVHIYTALSGELGLKLALEHNPDVVLLDVVMPGMDGFEVCRRLKNNETLRDIPVVFVTALKGDKDSRIKALEVGAEAFLAKPIDESELVAQIRAMVKIKFGNIARKEENKKLAALVAERTRELEELHVATLNLLDDLQKENEARSITEQALSESEALYRSILQASPDDITVTDTKGNIVMISDAGLSLLGTSNHNQVIGTCVFDYIHPDDRLRTEENFRVLIDESSYKPLECRIQGASERIVDVEINAEVIKNFDGALKGVVLVIRDITERKAEQKKIKESEELYRAILNASPDNIIIVDPNGNIQMLSPSTLKTYGYDNEREIVGLNITQIIASDDRNKILHELEMLLKGKNSGTYEYKCHRKDGDVFDVEVKGGIIRNAEGTVSQLVFILRDITDRKRAEADLEASEAKYKNLINNSPDAIMIYAKGKIVYVNNEAVHLMHASSKDDLLDNDFIRFIHPDNRELVLSRMEFVAQAPLYTSLPIVEEEYVRLDGSSYNVEIKPMRILFDGYDAVLLSGRDITDRKTAEKLILKSETQFRTVWQNSTNGLILLDEDGRILRINKSICAIFNVSEETLIGKTIYELSENDQFNDIVKQYKNIFTNRLTTNQEIGYKYGDGVQKWVQVESTYLDIEGEKSLMLGIINETTKRKHAEDKVKYISRLYALLGQVNQAVVRTHEAGKLLQKICDIAIKYGEFKLAWVGRYDSIADKIIPEFSSEHDFDYINKIIDTINSDEINYTPTRQAIRSQKIYCSNSIISDANMAALVTLASEYGYKSLAVIPLKVRNELYGVVNFYAAEDGFFNLEVQALIQEIGEDINYALNAIEAEHTRKQAEEALIESEDRYNTFINNNVDMIFVKDDRLRYLIANDAMASFLSVDKQDILFKTDDEIPSRHYQIQSFDTDALAISSEAPVTVIETIGDRIFETTKFRMRLKGGKFGIGGIRHDITERKKSQDELEESRQELKTIYDNAPVMMCVLDERGAVLFQNNEFEEFIKQSDTNIKGELLGNLLKCADSMSSQDGCGTGRFCNKCPLRHAIESTYTYEVEHRNIEYHSMLSIGGVPKAVYLLGSSSVIRSKGSKKILLCLYDITSRKEAEKALQKSEMFLRTFIDNAPFEIWARDKNNVGILENKMLVERFGSILGTKPTDRKDIRNEITALWESNNQRVLSGELIDEEIEFVLDDVKTEYHQVIFPIKINNEVIGIAGFNIDITEKKVAQKALHESQEQLKSFAAHLQSVREEERIILARDIHDDLGQILVAVKIELGMLGKKVQMSLNEDSLDDFMLQYQRLVKLVENTIETSRRFMDNLRPEVLDVLGFVEAFRKFIIAFEERYKVRCTLITNVEKLEIDSQRSVALYRILQESLNNVAKHAQANLVEVKLIATAENTIYLEIRDDGIGFDKNVRRRTNSYGLIGMKERAYLLDAQMNIQSKPGNGTTVSITLPLPEQKDIVLIS